MDCVTWAEVEELTVMKGSQEGVTEVVLNVIAYYIDQDPAPILDVEPSEPISKDYVTRRLDTMIRDTERLSTRILGPDGKKRSNQLEKKYPGGILSVAWATSPAQLAARPIRILTMNDIDRFPPSSGLEGDPYELARKRTQTFWNRKIVTNSSPTTRRVSKIEELFYNSNQQHYYVPCPHCFFYQKLIFSQKSQFKDLAHGWLVYKWDGSNITYVAYRCGNCQQDIPEVARYQMIRRGEWRAVHPERIKHQGFHISELYSPWSTWRDIAADWEKKKHRIETLRTFINTSLGETFDEDSNPMLSGDKLLDRREDYTRTTLPLEIILLTASVDAQEDRLECYVEGWGLDEENWLIDWFVAEGSPGKRETWNVLDSYLFGTQWQYQNGYKTGYGQIGGLMAVGVDSGGHHTTAAYDYVRRHRGQRIFALKGVPGFGRRIVEETKSKKVPVRLILVGVDEAKQLIFDRLQNKPGPGYQHFNRRAEKDYFDQLLSERKVIKVEKGRKVVAWQLIDQSRRNEALDCKVYSLAAYRKLNPNMRQLGEILKTRMERFEQQKGKIETIRESDTVGDQGTDSTQANSIETPVQPTRRSRKRFTLSKWLKS